MTDSKTDGIHTLAGVTELEAALVTVEMTLDTTFAAAGHEASTSQEGAGLILEQVLDLIYDTFGSVIPYDRIGLSIVEDDGEVMRSRWARSEAGSLTMGSGHSAPLDDAEIQNVLRGGEPMIVNDLEGYLQDHAQSQPARILTEEGMRSSLTCPLMAAGKPVGLMVFSSTETNAYTEEHRKLFAHIAAHVTTILERSRLYERLIELNWQLRVARDALEYQATHDGLTRLWNRSAIFDVAAQELDRAQRQGRPITIVMCDIDHFKEVNDAHGHMIGDAVLQAVSDRLAAALRSYETVGRYGGEEFLITLYDCDAEGAPFALERMREAVGGEGIKTDAGTIELTISLGAAVGEGDDIDLDELVRTADEALYEAKEAGRNRHVVRVVGSKAPAMSAPDATRSTAP